MRLLSTWDDSNFLTEPLGRTSLDFHYTSRCAMKASEALRKVNNAPFADKELAGVFNLRSATRLFGKGSLAQRSLVNASSTANTH